jgi:hypothetical protein
MAGPQISTARKRETAKLKSIWQNKKDARTEEWRQRYGEGFKGFDDLGEPVVEGVEARSLRGPELVRALERAFIASGDPIFDDALKAVRVYGLDQGGHKQIAKQTWGGNDERYLVQIQFLVERKRMSSRAATEQIVSEFFIDGHSFEAVNERVRHKFDEWRRSGYAPEVINYDAGDLGYLISVKPAPGVSLEALARGLPTQGEVQPATSFWRRVFREGAISIQYLGEK